MPECIEVAWTADCLKQLIIGKLYHNKVVVDVFSHGKQLFIQMEDNSYLNIHFGLTGYLSIYPNENYHRGTLIFTNSKTVGAGGISLYYYDKVHFGKIIPLSYSEYQDKIQKLGLDVMKPQEFTLGNFKTVIGSKRISISKFLMEQKYISGIGNYLKSEILYQARIFPHTKVDQLSSIQIANLFSSIRVVVYNSYLMGFINQHVTEYNQIAKNFNLQSIPLSRTKEYLDVKNPIPYRFEVYEQEKNSLGNKVTKETIDGRATFYVESLQKDLTYIKKIIE